MALRSRSVTAQERPKLVKGIVAVGPTANSRSRRRLAGVEQFSAIAEADAQYKREALVTVLAWLDATREGCNDGSRHRSASQPRIHRA